MLNEVSSIKGLEVVATSPASMNAYVKPGTVFWTDGTKTEIGSMLMLPIRSSGTREYRNHSYHIRGEASRGPAYWNGENIRGSGGAPYQRMVPNTLIVYNANRSVCYEEGKDYITDW